MIYRGWFDVPTWKWRSPIDELNRMRQRMEQLFEDVVAPYQRVSAGVFPQINLTEDKDHYYIRAELPGVKGDELDIQVTADNIAISGERNIALEEGARYHRREREAGRFSRMIELPGEIEAGKVEAKLENGILTVVIPKAEIAKPRQITIAS